MSCFVLHVLVSEGITCLQLFPRPSLYVGMEGLTFFAANESRVGLLLTVLTYSIYMYYGVVHYWSGAGPEEIE